MYKKHMGLNDNIKKDLRDENLTIRSKSFLHQNYTQIFVETLPSKGKFYPSNIEIGIRPGTGKDVQLWSSIDEKDLISVQEAMNKILENNLQIFVSGRKMDFKDLMEGDRLTILLMIRDLTFPETESKLVSQQSCSCGNGSIVVKYDKLTTLEVSKDIEKYFNKGTSSYIIKTKQGDEFELRPPTIGNSIAIFEYIKERRQKGKEINPMLTKLYPYMNKDWRDSTSRKVLQFEADMIGWTPLKMSILQKLVEDLNFAPNMMIKGNCENCGKELEGPLNFREGLKSIFNIQNIYSQLL